MPLRAARLAGLLGATVPLDDAEAILTRLGFGVERVAGAVGGDRVERVLKAGEALGERLGLGAGRVRHATEAAVERLAAPGTAAARSRSACPPGAARTSLARRT